jgi:hypothetical protein
MKGFLKRVFGPGPPAAPPEQQAVLVHLDGTGLPASIYEQHDLATLEERLQEAIEHAAVGEYDGNDFAETEVTLYAYGADAEKLFAAMEPILREYPLCRNARVVVRPGGPDTPGRELRLPAA